MAYEIDQDNYLSHIGVIERSGRYPWGSGEDPYQRLRDFKASVAKLRKDGLTNDEIAKGLGFATRDDLDGYITMANNDLRRHDVNRARDLRNKAWSMSAIAKELGLSGESQVRALLKPDALAKQEKFDNDLGQIRKEVDKKKMIDVSRGFESEMGITETHKKRLLHELKTEGYQVHTVYEKSMAGNVQAVNVLVAPGIDSKEAFANRGEIQRLTGTLSKSRGESLLGLAPPIAVDPNRVDVVYGGEGGELKDGVIYVRPGAKDLDMGNNRYAQVRIQVGDKHYLKGMAVQSDDLPDGVDLLFHTNKDRSVGKMEVMKQLKTVKSTGEVDKDNPFGAVVDQIKEVGPDGKLRATSAMNLVNEEADWDSWSKNLASQFLSKQSPKLVRSQLEMTRANKQAELEAISELENPVVKRYMLNKFADSADGAAVHLKAAHLPGQKTHVILPINSLKENEVFAPNFDNGTRLALVRYPHGGTFEIPELVVNNKNPDGLKIIGNDSKSALGINASVAERLSGADFDGDTVVAIPNDSGRVKSTPALESLKNFDPHTEYPHYEGMKQMTKKDIPQQMGGISNLITDMTVKGAPTDEIARAVRHSMVVIDAEKHKLDYTRSYDDNQIAALKERYQGRANAGASTIISRASASTRVDERRERRASEGGPIDLETGEKVYTPTDRTFVKKRRKKDADGNVVTGPDGKAVWEEVGGEQRVQVKSTRMAETNDARTLVSDDPAPVEILYATHANEMKALANRARLEQYRTPKLKRDPIKTKEYQEEVDSLAYKLRVAQANAPRERQAQRVANVILKTKLEDNPGADNEDVRRYKAQALETARARVGADKARIVPTDREWEAIQSGAVSQTRLEQILQHGNTDAIVKLATPKKRSGLTTSQVSLIKSMSARGYTQAEIAQHLGVSTGTVSDAL